MRERAGEQTLHRGERKAAQTTKAAGAKLMVASGPSRPRKTPKKKGKSTVAVEKATDATNAMINKCLEVENAQRDKKLRDQEVGKERNRERASLSRWFFLSWRSSLQFRRSSVSSGPPTAAELLAGSVSHMSNFSAHLCLPDRSCSSIFPASKAQASQQNLAHFVGVALLP